MVKAELQQVKLRFGIVGNSEGLLRAIDVAMQVAPTDMSVLITGESGVGKESFPQIIHQNSRRKHGQYIAVNCGAIPEGTIDSELFGHEKGAFTGAISERKGYFGEADGGTIFLDEVGELPMPTQARLLRVLENGEFIKVGSSKVEKTNVRIVAATNVNLERAIANGRFREDLFYRLSTVPIQVPPLRERGEDVALLFRKFATDFAEKYHMPPIQLNEAAKKMLLSYAWPGNVRQLKNVTERISIIETSRDITPEILQVYLPKSRVEQQLPMRFGDAQQGFEGERELLYKVIFDLKQELNELRQKVEHLSASSAIAPGYYSSHQAVDTTTHPVVTTTHPMVQGSHPAVASHPAMMPGTAVLPSNPQVLNTPSAEEVGVTTIIRTPKHPVSSIKDDEIQDATEFEETAISIDEAERELIQRALARNRGRRRLAAQELNISERTLYRKIKEYGLE